MTRFAAGRAWNACSILGASSRHTFWIAKGRSNSLMGCSSTRLGMTNNHDDSAGRFPLLAKRCPFGEIWTDVSGGILVDIARESQSHLPNLLVGKLASRRCGAMTPSEVFFTAFR